jgi:hypothetical protein
LEECASQKQLMLDLFNITQEIAYLEGQIALQNAAHEELSLGLSKPAKKRFTKFNLQNAH